MQIRLATKNDLSQIINLINEVVPLMNKNGNFQWDENYPNMEVFDNDIQQQQLWVADEDGIIAGIAAITTDQEPEYATIGWDITETAIVTHRLAVSNLYRGKGIARALLLKAEEIGMKRGINILRIDTNSNNEATQKLFPTVGYKFSGKIDLGFRPGLRFLCYEKRW